MLRRIRAMFARVQSGGPITKIVRGVGVTASGAAACFAGGTLLLHAGQYLREAEDRRRSVDRLVKSAFFAEPPIVEIPRKAAEAGRALVVGSLVSAVHELLAPG